MRLDSLIQDVRYALRRLAATPGFTVVAILTLALGLGANTIVFSLINAVFFPPRPVVEPERLVSFGWQSRLRPHLGGTLLSYPEFLDVRSHRDLFGTVCAISPVEHGLSVGGETHAASGYLASEDCFGTYGLTPSRGRLFGPGDGVGAGDQAVAVIGESLWRRRFGGQDDAIGSRFRFGGHELTVIGVAPAGYGPDVWVPLAIANQLAMRDLPLEGLFSDRTLRRTAVIARLQPGVTIDDVEARLPAMTSMFSEADPTRTDDDQLRVRQTFDQRTGWVYGQALRLLALSGVVLFIACANLAGLLLARGLGRSKEIAVRMTLGAPRWRVLRQLMLENLLLACGGGAAAFGLTLAFARSLRLLNPPADSPWTRLLQPQMDWRVLLCALGLAILAALAFGLGPSLRASRRDVGRALEGGPMIVTGSSRRLSNVRNLLLMAQFAVSTLLVLVAGVFVASFFLLSTADTGINKMDAGTIEIAVWVTRPTTEDVRQFTSELQRRALQYPALHGVTFASNLPSGVGVSAVWLENPRPGSAYTAAQTRAGPGLFDALGIPLIQGRDFNDHDRPDTPPVAIVSAAAAERWWPGETPLGKRLEVNGLKGVRLEVVGVVANTRANTRANMVRGDEEMLYLAMSQHARTSLLVIGSSRSGSGAAIAALKRLIHDVDPAMPMADARTVRQRLAGAIYTRWLLAVGVGSLAGLALFLAALGLYGAMSYVVSQQTRELGVRMALGAGAADVRRMVLWQGMRVVGAGAAVGIYAAALAVEIIQSLTMGVLNLAPAFFAVGPLVLMLAALVACYVPARRASLVDPMVALRSL